MKCIVCGKLFKLKKNKKQKCCSRKCNAINHNKEMAKKFKVPICPVCGKETRRLSRAKYCSTKCHQLSQKGKGSSSWKGGRKKSGGGYIAIHKPNHPKCDVNGYILEHRYLMEKHLGRPLTTIERIHHINGIKDDNRIENMVLLKSQAEHLKQHNYFLEEQNKARIKRQSS